MAVLAHGCVRRVADSTVHALQHVAVGVQRLRYGGVPQELLDVLRMNIAGEQRGAGVTQVMESYGRQARLLQEPREGSLAEVGRVDRRANLAGEDNTFILVEISGRDLLGAQTALPDG